MSKDAPSVHLTAEDLHEYIEAGDAKACSHVLDNQPSADVLRALTGLTDELRARLLSMLTPDEATDVLEQLPDSQAVKAIEDLEPDAAARIIEEMPSDDQADLIGQLDHEDVQAILEEMEAEDAEDIRRLAKYEDDVAGGLMVTEFLSYQSGRTVEYVINDLGANAKDYADYDIQYLYVIDPNEKLIGVLRMRDLLLAPRQTPIGDLMIADPVSVTDRTPLEELVAIFHDFKFFGVPVVDAKGHLCGVLHRVAVEEAVADDSDKNYLQSQGIVGGEELRSMPTLLRARRRLSWLSVNILLNIAAASIIAMHQDTLEAVIALAVFLPIISDMSGCSGNQAVAVSMREITLGVVRPQDAFRVLWGELRVGIINGIALGLLIGLVAFIWKGNVYLGGVVGVALMLNTLVAVAIGGCVPLLLTRMKMDPALASGPILTTITDMCGFLLVLSFASAVLAQLS